MNSTMISMKPSMSHLKYELWNHGLGAAALCRMKRMKEGEGRGTVWVRGLQVRGRVSWC